MTSATRIQLRSDVASAWSTFNPVLAAGEFGVETDTSKFKIGDGVTAWSVLPYSATSGITQSYADGHYIPLSVVSGVSDTSGRSNIATVKSGVISSVRYRPLFADDSYVIAGSNADQSTGIQSFVSAVAAVGGTGDFPDCSINLGNTTITPPGGTTSIVLRGTYGQGGPVLGSGGTQFYHSSPIAGGPHVTPILDLRTVGRATVEGIGFRGPNTFANQYGGLTSAVCGIAAGPQSHLERVGLQYLSSGVLYGKPDGSNGYDHSKLTSIYGSYLGYAINLLADSSAGDMKWRDVNTQSTCAGLAISGKSAGMLGSNWTGVDLLAPISIYRYWASGMGSSATFISNHLIGTSFEAAWHSCLLDSQYANGSVLGFMQDNVISGGLYALTTAGDGQPWSKSFAAASGSGTTLTLTDGSGWFFDPGMTVSDGGSKIPAGTTIVAGGVAGTWPWATVTLTLSQSLTGTVTNPVVVSQPSLGAWVIGQIRDNEMLGNMMTATTSLAGLPYWYASQYFQNNRIRDGLTAYKAALLGQLVNYLLTRDTIGNMWGEGGLQGGHGRMAVGETCTFGDVLQAQGGTNMLTKADGTRKPLGVALRTQGTSGGNVDYLSRAQTEGYAWPIINKQSATTIAPYALIGPDPANPGGVVAVANVGLACGINWSTTIPANSAGRASELWCR